MNNHLNNFILIVTGEEILSGQRQDRHVQFITERLEPLGLHCLRCEFIGDNVDYLTRKIKAALSETSLILVTGGLGPTVDDVTRDAISEATGIAMEQNPNVLQMLEERFRSFGRAMTKNNLCQALVPVNGTFFPNPHGTAVGLVFDPGDLCVIALPGPPRELFPMVEAHLLPFLKARYHLEARGFLQKFRFCCIGESNVDQSLRDHIGFVLDLKISLIAQLGLVDLTLSLPSDANDAKNRMRQYSTIIRESLGPFLYSENQDTLERVIGRILSEKQDTLAVAESCTGGMLGERITSVPGSSKYFWGGILSYSNSAKVDLLEVKKDTIKKYGAVSRETVCEMAEGVRQTFHSTWGIAITGIAGPDGGTPEKPVGTVWIAAAHAGEVVPFRLLCFGERDAVRKRSCVYALDHLRRLLTNLLPHPIF